MNVLLIVIDSLRSAALFTAEHGTPRTPFLSRLRQETVFFRRAYASECWTLPAHMSMFTGLLPSEHGAHFQTMAYTGKAPTVAELLRDAGHHTEVITRNSIFDGTLPGVTRGFAARSYPMAPVTSPMQVLLTLSKPRVRRLIRESGFLHSAQKSNRDFVKTMARMALPADETALQLALERLRTLHAARQPFFLFANLYDVHAPYAPSPISSFSPLDSWEHLVENFISVFALQKVSSHAYLRDDFRISRRTRRVLLDRYHRAVELMDQKLERFITTLRHERLLEDTLLIVTSDHGEAFGDHGLYFHDASLFDTHLHVPLWVQHPEMAPEIVDDVVSTRDLFGLISAAGLRGGTAERHDTILDASYRQRRPVALAEHFHYPHGTRIQARFRKNLAAAVTPRRKIIARTPSYEAFDRDQDLPEERPDTVALQDFANVCRDDGLPTDATDLLTQHCAPRPALRTA